MNASNANLAPVSGALPGNSASPVPGIPSEELIPDLQDLTEIFTLYYRKGGDMLNLHFRFPRKDVTTSREHFRLAIDRAKIHCERMRFRFLFCRPYITDLEIEEQRMAI